MQEQPSFSAPSVQLVHFDVNVLVSSWLTHGGILLSKEFKNSPKNTLFFDYHCFEVFFPGSSMNHCHQYENKPLSCTVCSK